MLTLLSLPLLVACLSEPATESGQLCHVPPEHTGVEPDHQQESDEERTQAKCCSVSLVQKEATDFPLVDINTNVTVAFLNALFVPFCFSQIRYAGVRRGQDHHTSRGPKDEPQLPATH